MKIHKEGTKSIVFAFIFLLIVNAVFYRFMSGNIMFLWLLCLVSLFVLGLIVYFFRIPVRRQFGNNATATYSPADGKVVDIRTVNVEEFDLGEKVKISIFLSIFNVHINWFPVSGKVLESVYHPGKYLMAFHPKASEKNEHSSVLLQTEEKNTILVRQIAGFVARRIVCYAQKGKVAQQGEQLGFIKFGSRVDVFLPKDFQIKVKKGDKVTGMQSILGTTNE